jgi:uncharacterized repeat protein (TIGR02543 family)
VKRVLSLALSLAVLLLMLPVLPAAAVVITAVALPVEGGTVTGGRNDYNPDDSAVLVATPNPGYVFVGWYEDNVLITNEPTYPFMVIGDRTLTARFRNPAQNYTVTANAAAGGGGTVTGGGVFSFGDTATLTATPNTGYIFDGWYEGGTRLHPNPAPATFSFPVETDRTIEARFTDPSSPRIEVTLNANGGTGVPSFLIKTQGQALTLPRPTRSGYTFVGWHTSLPPLTGVTVPEYLSPNGLTYSDDVSVTLFAVWDLRTGVMPSWPIMLLAAFGVFMLILGGTMLRKKRKK